jgi:glycosyltransferase involved in cell wall biosynthesis
MHLIATNFYGGPERQIIGHLVRLNPSQYQCALTSFIEDNTENEILKEAAAQNLINFGIEMRNPFDVKAWRRLIQLLKEEKVQLLVTHGYKSCVLGLFAARYLHIPVIAYSRGYTTENIKVALYEKMDRLALRFMDGIIAVSAAQKKKLTALGLKNKNFWVVPNAIATDMFTSSPSAEKRKAFYKAQNIPLDATLVVTAGRLSPEKGHIYLLQAIQHIYNRLSNTYFMFCGDGPLLQSLTEFAAQAGILEHCKFPGFRSDLKDIFNYMDLFVLPSLTEGLPNVILESFACSKPVIATRVGGVPEIVEHKQNGLIVPPADFQQLGAAILELISSPSLRGEMGRAGYQTVKANFTFEQQTRNLTDIYALVSGVKK